jgi:hypothetical protein
LWRPLRFAPDKFFFDHLGQIVVAIVMLKDLNQLGIRQRLKRNGFAVLCLFVFVQGENYRSWDDRKVRRMREVMRDVWS